MTAARNYPRPLRAVPVIPADKPPPAVESGVGLIAQRAPIINDLVLDDDDLTSLRPQAPPLPPKAAPVATPTEPAAVPALPDATDDLPVMNEAYASLSLEAEGDAEVMRLMSSKQRSRRTAWLVCLAFPAIIALALFSISGDGMVKEPLSAILATATDSASSIHHKIENERKELEAIKAELAKAEQAPAEPPKDKGRHKGLPGRRR